MANWEEKAPLDPAHAVRIQLTPRQKDWCVSLRTWDTSDPEAPQYSVSAVDMYWSDAEWFAEEFRAYIWDIDPDYPHSGTKLSRRQRAEVRSMVNLVKKLDAAVGHRRSEGLLSSRRHFYAGADPYQAP